MQINQLPTIPQAPDNADVLAIEVNGVTYKVSKSNLASAIISHLGGDPVTVAHGGTGAANAAAARTNLEITPANIGAVSRTAPNVDRGVNYYTNQDYDVAPGSETYNYIAAVTDDDNFMRGGVYSIRATDGSFRNVLVARKPGSPSNIWAEFGPRIASNGTVSYAVTVPSALRNALGLGNTIGAVPVANGGTGGTTAEAARTNLCTPYTAYVDANEWDTLFEELNIIANGGSGIFLLSANAATALSNGKVNAMLVATIFKSGTAGSNNFRIMASSDTGANMYSWKITGASASGRTTGTVYQYSGTAI